MRQDPSLSQFTALNARGHGYLQDQAHDYKEQLFGVGSNFSPQNQASVAVLAGVEEREQLEVPPGAGCGLCGCSQLPGRSHLGAVVGPTVQDMPIPGCMEAVGAWHH